MRAGPRTAHVTAVPSRTRLILFGQLGPGICELRFNCSIFLFLPFIYLYGKLLRNLKC